MRSRLTWMMALSLAYGLTVLAGCEVIAHSSYVLFGGDPKPVDVAARYTGLQGKRVAVLVSADDYALFRFPRSTFFVSHSVSQEIADHVLEVSLSAPSQLAEFQSRNPYWSTRRPSQLIEQLGVDRLIIIDINEYRTNEPGNEHIWAGVIDGYVSVYESDAADPDNRVFEDQVSVKYPDGTKIGTIEGSEQSVQAGMLGLFGNEVAWLFYDHKEPG